MKRTAFLSMYHKPGIAEFARQLIELDWEIVASGGTAAEIAKPGLPVRNVRMIDDGGTTTTMEHWTIPLSDLVCVDLCPLKENIDRPDSARRSVTDIYGLSLLLSSANFGRIVICDPEDRQPVIDWLKAGEPDREQFIRGLCAKAEATVANYCLASARYQSKGGYDGFIGERVMICQYGENRWQTPAEMYRALGGTPDPLALDKFQLVAGQPLSYNNVCDIDRLLQTITHIAAGFEVNQTLFPRPYQADGVKHGNSCGAAVGSSALEVSEKMINGDLRAIMGGLIMTNFVVNEEYAETLLTHMMRDGGRRLLDGIIAPQFTAGAIELLRRKKDKCRLVVNPALINLNRNTLDTAARFRYIRGGRLKQPNYTFVLNLEDERIEKIGPPINSQVENDLVLAWAVGSTSNSNTITLVKKSQLIGNGVGQQDRVGAAELALKRARDAGHDPADAVAYSDSFFPYTDGVEVLIKAGIKAILASSGSRGDEAVKEVCRKARVSLYLIPDKVGRGFFGH